jgi:hypothetical protein
MVFFIVLIQKMFILDNKKCGVGKKHAVLKPAAQLVDAGTQSPRLLSTPASQGGPVLFAQKINSLSTRRHSAEPGV